MRTLSGAVLVLVMALGTGGIGCSDGDADVSSQLAAFEASIDAAQAAADSASAAAASAQGTADSASAAASNAQDAAANAQGTADSASAAASNAQNAANNAQGTATSAQNAANTAQDAANSAQSAATVNADTIATLENLHRFFACADGVTVEDTATGLLWERKTGDPSDPDVICSTAAGGCPDRHDVNNRYEWSNTVTAADGNAYTDFLATINAASFAGHTNWRLPIISELQSILVGQDVEFAANAAPPDPNSGLNATGQATTCAGGPCIDPGFAAIGGPTAQSRYWSASTLVTSPGSAWTAGFSNGFVDIGIFVSKTLVYFVRAVRTGSCSS
jgi:hypothetical protein